MLVSPLSKMWNEHFGSILRAEELQLLVLLRLFGSARPRDSNRQRYLPDHELQTGRQPECLSSACCLYAVEYIMRDVSGGWIIRYMHSTGASFFFIVVYLHMFRGLIYGSYKNARIGVDFRFPDFLGIDGRSLYGLSVALGSNVLLGRAGDY